MVDGYTGPRWVVTRTGVKGVYITLWFPEETLNLLTLVYKLPLLLQTVGLSVVRVSHTRRQVHGPSTFHKLDLLQILILKNVLIEQP